MTVYNEVTAADTDVAALIAAHPESVNLYKLPVKIWVARQDGAIVAIMMLKTHPYVSVDLVVAEPKTRPFMRMVKLLRMAEQWLKDHNVPIVCIAITNVQPHFQSLVQKLGYQAVGEETDDDGNPVETIFGKQLLQREEQAVA